MGNPPCPAKFLDKRITRRPVIQARSRLSSQGHAGLTPEVGEKPMMGIVTLLGLPAVICGHKCRS